VAPKGSVCLDGVSLTVNAVDARGFMVGLIAHTLAVTNLGGRAVGSKLNIEVDLVARYVARLLAPACEATAPGVTPELLRQAGFIAEGT
jgi:riboflavin synthase